MEHLDVLVKLATLMLGFGAIAKWIVNRIERGQKGVRRDFKVIRKELKKRMSKDECERLRSHCPCTKIQKGTSHEKFI